MSGISIFHAVYDSHCHSSADNYARLTYFPCSLHGLQTRMAQGAWEVQARETAAQGLRQAIRNEVSKAVEPVAPRFGGVSIRSPYPDLTVTT
jgi:hypothetical protein